MNWDYATAAARVLDDGLGERRVETNPSDGTACEVLEVSPALAVHDEFEAAIRTRAVQMGDASVDGIARIRRVERAGSSLRIVADHVEGLRLPDFLQEAIKGKIPLPQPAALELAGRILRIVSALHQVPGMSHGAITPSHVVITRAGGVVLTDGVFGPALEGLHRNREQLWREFRLALPASASLPRFDQRADVTQLGATVLSIALGRCLRESEYPRAINEVVIAATLAARPGETGTSASALRMWLQESLHLHPRSTFASVLDAERAFNEVLGAAASRRGGVAALDASIARIFGDTPASTHAAELAAAWSQPAALHHTVASTPPAQPAVVPAPRAPQPPRRDLPFSSRLRAVLPNLFA